MKIKLIMFFWGVFSFSGCGKYLDVVPEKDILSIDAIFEKRLSAGEFHMTTYVGLPAIIGTFSKDPSFLCSDEFVTGEMMRNSGMYDYCPPLKIAEGIQDLNSPYCSLWGKNEARKYADVYLNIANCNTFISNIDKVYNMTDREKAMWKAEVKAVKAFYYFLLVRQYGPIVLVPENISVSNDIYVMQIPRSTIDQCFKAIVDLLEEAIPNLANAKNKLNEEKAFFSKEMALALKAKVLLFAASPLFNDPEGTFANFTNRDGVKLFPAYDKNKWKLAADAAREAITECEKSMELTSGTTTLPSELLNKMMDIELSTTYRTASYTESFYLLKTTSSIFYTTPKMVGNGSAFGCVNPTMKMVEMFYTKNGLPINKDASWKYDERYKTEVESDQLYNGVVSLSEPVLKLHLRREPRFYANIAFDRAVFYTSESGNIIKARKDEDYGVEDDIISATAAQNLTGYWSKKFLSTQQNPAEISRTSVFDYPIIRLAELYLIFAEAMNEYSGPSQEVYDEIDKVRLRAGIPKLQEAWTNFSNDPSRITKQDGMREIIRQERAIELCFEGHRYWDLKRWKIAHEELNMDVMGWNIFGRDEQSYYNNYTAPIKVWGKNKFNFPRDYFWPIRSEEIMIANIKQSQGW